MFGTAVTATDMMHAALFAGAMALASILFTLTALKLYDFGKFIINRVRRSSELHCEGRRKNRVRK